MGEKMEEHEEQDTAFLEKTQMPVMDAKNEVMEQIYAEVIDLVVETGRRLQMEP
jgi:hypothetical protein